MLRCQHAGFEVMSLIKELTYLLTNWFNQPASKRKNPPRIHVFQGSILGHRKKEARLGPHGQKCCWPASPSTPINILPAVCPTQSCTVCIQSVQKTTTRLLCWGTKKKKKQTFHAFFPECTITQKLIVEEMHSAKRHIGKVSRQAEAVEHNHCMQTRHLFEAELK